MSLVPTKEDQAYHRGYVQAAQSGGMVIDLLQHRLNEANARIKELEGAIRDTIESLERNSTSAPVVECLKAALCGHQQQGET
jgi:hypothetical protein